MGTMGTSYTWLKEKKCHMVTNTHQKKKKKSNHSQPTAKTDKLHVKGC